MPWRSEAQRRWGNSPAGRAALGASGVAEWNAASKGLKLPARKASGGSVQQGAGQAFRVPLDCLRKLGGGDAITGMIILYDMFGPAAHPGVGPPGTISPDGVADIGHGNPIAGRRVLQKFCAKVRRQPSRPLSRLAVSMDTRNG